MTYLIKRFWMLCLVPLVVPMAFLPWQVNAGLALVGAISLARRYS